jgi:cysteine-rich repeat protein
VWNGNEECDDGNNQNGDGCDANCNAEQSCGNGMCENGEDYCNCASDCANDPNVCHPCQCGSFAGACWCDEACLLFDDCCANGPC